jgi:hypothetical protein
MVQHAGSMNTLICHLGVVNALYLNHDVLLALQSQAAALQLSMLWSGILHQRTVRKVCMSTVLKKTHRGP